MLFRSKILGLTDRGHLGVGAKADISVYDIDVNDFDATRKCNSPIVEEKLLNSLYTIKDGEILVKDGEITKLVGSRHVWTNVCGLEDKEEELINRIKPDFNRFYTIKYENYGVSDHYLECENRVDVKPGCDI